jgi:hypothetical protein
MSDARTNPVLALPWLIAGGVAAAGAFWWMRNSAAEAELTPPAEAMLIDDSMWEEEDTSIPDAALPSVPGSAAAEAVMSDPDPRKDRTKIQAAIKLAKAYLKTKARHKPKDFKWRSKKGKKGLLVTATRNKDGSKLVYLVTKQGDVKVLKPEKSGGPMPLSTPGPLTSFSPFGSRSSGPRIAATVAAHAPPAGTSMADILAAQAQRLAAEKAAAAAIATAHYQTSFAATRPAPATPATAADVLAIQHFNASLAATRAPTIIRPTGYVRMGTVIGGTAR